MFVNVPARDRSPGAGNQEQRLKYKGIIKTFNSVLADHVAKFQSDHPDANVISIDAFTLFNEYLDQAKELGFKDISSFCPNSTASDFNTNYEKYGCLAPYE
ncbi:hypothetical protein LRAMOSA04999 [Lichtheimia ramosa]|uniref:Uncharacterized protein n=1 Tax=Lichtheimia ramosa TaxID=688394 RepID=A0A077WZS6_9FUNG|nr:hypothetical protein LRAMOSA04999 [Lichtheimia ramosa]